MEFGLSLDGPPAAWFKTQPLSSFPSFETPASKFRKLFQSHVPLKQLHVAYYLAAQNEGEHITDFYMHFYSLMQRLPTLPAIDGQIHTFLWGVATGL